MVPDAESHRKRLGIDFNIGIIFYDIHIIIEFLRAEGEDQFKVKIVSRSFCGIDLHAGTHRRAIIGLIIIVRTLDLDDAIITVHGTQRRGYLFVWQEYDLHAGIPSQGKEVITGSTEDGNIGNREIGQPSAEAAVINARAQAEIQTVIGQRRLRFSVNGKEYQGCEKTKECEFFHFFDGLKKESTPKSHLEINS